MPQNNTENNRKFYEVHAANDWTDIPGQWATVTPETILSWQALWDSSLDALTDGALCVSWSVKGGLEFFNTDECVQRQLPGNLWQDVYLQVHPEKDQEYFCTLHIYGKVMGLEFGPKYGELMHIEISTPKGWYR